MEKHGAGINGLFLDFLKNVLNMVAICAHGPKWEPLAYVFFFLSHLFTLCTEYHHVGLKLGKLYK